MKDTVPKIYEDSHPWFEAQKAMVEEEQRGLAENVIGNKWEAPKGDDQKCNIALQWSKQRMVIRATWVLRNDKGEVLLHSRRTFSKIKSFLDAKFIALMWAVEVIMGKKVIFETEFSDLFGEVKRQMDWPALRYQGSELRKALKDLRLRTHRVITSKANRCAGAIAKSALQVRWFMSYVGQGNSHWLQDLFEADKQGI